MLPPLFFTVFILGLFYPLSAWLEHSNPLEGLEGMPTARSISIYFLNQHAHCL